MSKSDEEFSSEVFEKLRYKTPYFLFSEKVIENNYDKFKSLFPNSSIQYAMKANSEKRVLQILDKMKCGFEVASVGELRMLKKLKVEPSRIIYGTSVKPEPHIKEFFSYGVELFAADSLPELEKIAKWAPGAKVYIRTLVNDTGSVFRFSEKFGTQKENIISLMLYARQLGLTPYGISFHVGSQASDGMAWAHAINELKPIIRELVKKGIIISILNIGGGFPCKYASSESVPMLEEISQHVLAAYRRASLSSRLLLEPGRAIIATAGVLVASVIARVERPNSTWLFLDAGVYNGLFEAMAYQGSTRYSITSIRQIGDLGASLFSLAGPTGDSPDVISREALLPSDITVGDRIIFHSAGAYSLSVASEFNGFAKPKVYFI